MSLRLYYRFLTMREILQNQKEGRVLVGFDRFGSKLFQYISPFGLPTKRSCEHLSIRLEKYRDMALYDWVYNKEEFLPDREKIADRRLAERERRLKGLQWDREQKAALEAKVGKDRIDLRGAGIQEWALGPGKKD